MRTLAPRPLFPLCKTIKLFFITDAEYFDTGADYHSIPDLPTHVIDHCYTQAPEPTQQGKPA